jgi:hypothetical protein
MSEETLEQLVRVLQADCDRLRAVPAFWSDWFTLAAKTLAVLYEWRGRESGKPVREWLARMMELEGGTSMVTQVENFLANADKPDRS